MSSSAAAPPPPPPPPSADPTFRNYTSAQAAAYAASRRGYAKELYDYVLDQHTSTGGKLGTLLDVGCGPGNATHDLAPHFDRAVGVDPGQEMLARARQNGSTTGTGDRVRFALGPAEEVASVVTADKELGIQEGSVNLIVCAMSAHWFQLDRFYPEAARLLAPDGSLIMWTCGSFYVHPRKTPHAAAIREVLRELEEETLMPYIKLGNMLSYHVYDGLPLPWDVVGDGVDDEHGKDGLERAFPRDRMRRRAWNRNGEIPPGQDDFFAGTSEASLRDVQAAIGTASMVTRWRAANPDIANTDRDCVAVAVAKIRDILGTRPEDDATTKLLAGMATGMIVLKRA